MTDLTVTGRSAVAAALARAFIVAGIDPEKDSLFSTARTFKKLGLRHLLIHLKNGGILCLCSDPEMASRLTDAVRKIDNELDAEAEGSND